MASFVTKQVSTQTLGELLTGYRAHLGLSVNEIARLCKIQARYLQALEDGDYAKLPSAVYVKGFLKNLAIIYRTDSKKFLEQYEQENLVEINLTDLTALGQKKADRPRFVFTPRTAAFTVIGLVGLGMLGYLYFQISSLRRPPELAITSPFADSTLDSGLAVVSGRTESGAAVFLNGQPITVDIQGMFSESLSLAPGNNELTIKAVNRFGRETVVTRSVFLVEKEIAGSSTP